MSTPTNPACDGSYACPAPHHIHGCFSDDPCQHFDEVVTGWTHLPELEQLRQLTAAAIAYHEMPASSWRASSSSPNEQARAAATQAFREAIAALGPVVRVWAGEQT